MTISSNVLEEEVMMDMIRRCGDYQ